MNGIQSNNLVETVRAEALATTYQRHLAGSQSGATNAAPRGPDAAAWSIGDKLRELAEEIAAEHRLDSHRRLRTPSDLIATMRADWPEQAATVQAFADAQGLKLGEAWALIIADAVDHLRGGANE